MYDITEYELTIDIKNGKMDKMKRIMSIVVCLMLCLSTIIILSVARYPCTNPDGHVYEHT